MDSHEKKKLLLSRQEDSLDGIRYCWLCATAIRTSTFGLEYSFWSRAMHLA